VLEPQSTVLIVLLVAAFGGLMWWILVARRTVVRVLAATVAFVLAMQTGIMVVNKYFGYYQTWGAVVSDLASRSPGSAPRLPATEKLPSSWLRSFDERDLDLGRRAAWQHGDTIRLWLTGQRSHITRVVYVYLPPQYFQPAYRDYKFPAIELLHGQPGEPQDWIDVVGVTADLYRLMREGLARPAVLIMPDVNGGNRISLQCLNQVDGPQDLTYLAVDLPAEISRVLRVQPPGRAWGVAGYSEGGFCAANIALRFPHSYGFAAVLSGYFSPYDNQLPGRGAYVNPFGGNPRLRRENTPFDEVAALPAGAVIPQFWLSAGKEDAQDVANADYFWQELQLHEANVPLILSPGKHSMAAWRADVPLMLEWMTRGLAAAVRQQPGGPGQRGVAQHPTAGRPAS
jgi:enterochelin esterase-like enzyme